MNALDLRLLILLMKDDILIRDYKTTDKSTVLELLRLNTPEYFSPEEENFFIHYLDNELEYYYILEVNKRTVGCGGFNFPENATSARISWDITRFWLYNFDSPRNEYFVMHWSMWSRGQSLKWIIEIKRLYRPGIVLLDRRNVRLTSKFYF